MSASVKLNALLRLLLGVAIIVASKWVKVRMLGAWPSNEKTIEIVVIAIMSLLLVRFSLVPYLELCGLRFDGLGRKDDE